MIKNYVNSSSHFLSIVHAAHLCPTVPFQTILPLPSNSCQLGKKGLILFTLGVSSQQLSTTPLPLYLLVAAMGYVTIYIYIYINMYIFIYKHIHNIYIYFFFFFHHTTCESTCDTLTSSAANQGDNTVSVAQGGTATPGATKQLLPPDI